MGDAPAIDLIFIQLIATMAQLSIEILYPISTDALKSRCRFLQQAPKKLNSLHLREEGWQIYITPCFRE